MKESKIKRLAYRMMWREESWSIRRGEESWWREGTKCDERIIEL